MANRLNLNFNLETNLERAEFLNKYLTRPEFQTRPPTEDELEMMGNYVLWGKDPHTQKNVVQSKEIQIETRNGTWDSSAPESLDALVESPTFNEATLRREPTKVPREVFDRKDALARSGDLRPTLEALFRQIDELDLAINFYDLAHGKRKNPPRPQLLAQFNSEDVAALEAEAAAWSQFAYLKRRHLLVELRRQQYTLRDSFSTQIMRHTPPPMEIDPGVVSFDVAPLGLKNASTLARIIF